jgi:hypothetical protein
MKKGILLVSCFVAIVAAFTFAHTPRAIAGSGAQCTPCRKTADCGPKLQCYDGMCKKFKSDKC